MSLLFAAIAVSIAACDADGDGDGPGPEGSPVIEDEASSPAVAPPENAESIPNAPDGPFGHDEEIAGFAQPLSDPDYVIAAEPSDLTTLDCRADETGVPRNGRLIALGGLGYVEVRDPTSLGLFEEIGISSSEEVEVRRVDYINEEGEQVSLYVAGVDPNELDAFLASASVCFNLSPFDATADPEPDSASVDVGRVILDSTHDLLEVSDNLRSPFEGELARLRDQLSQREGISYFDLISSLLSDHSGLVADFAGRPTEDLNPDDFIESAIRALENAIIDLGVQVDGDVQSLAVTLAETRFNQPDAQFLVDPAELPSGDPLSESSYSRVLTSRAQPVLVVVEPIVDEAVYKDGARVDFVIDPIVHRHRSVYYRAKCVYAAKVSTHTSSGATTAYLYQWGPYATHGSRYGSATWKPQSGQIRRTRSMSSVSFDVKVKGWANGSEYEIFGYWTQGSGGRC